MRKTGRCPACRRRTPKAGPVVTVERVADGESDTYHASCAVAAYAAVSGYLGLFVITHRGFD